MTSKERTVAEMLEVLDFDEVVLLEVLDFDDVVDETVVELDVVVPLDRTMSADNSMYHHLVREALPSLEPTPLMSAIAPLHSGRIHIPRRMIRHPPGLTCRTATNGHGLRNGVDLASCLSNCHGNDRRVNLWSAMSLERPSVQSYKAQHRKDSIPVTVAVVEVCVSVLTVVVRTVVPVAH